MQTTDNHNIIDDMCTNCIVENCNKMDTEGFLPGCPKDTSFHSLGEVGLVPPLCPVCSTIVDKEIPHEKLLRKALNRIEKLHAACIKCGDLFSACEGTTVEEWDSRCNDPEQSDDPFCHDLAFWP